LKHILVFGAGKSSTFLIDYLVAQLLSNNWRLTVLDSNLNAAQEKTGSAPNTFAAFVNVSDDESRRKWIAESDLVISLLPPTLHYLVAVDCLHFGKHLLTASYVDAQIRSLEKEARNKGVLLLCECGLDPGIDHMSAMKILHSLRKKGATVNSFRSHCGGLVAPESDDNPWRYKISWNPRNVVLAGKAGADFREEGETRHLIYKDLFDPSRMVEVEDLGVLSWYPNRDSLSYVDTYGLHDAQTFIRTTLRHPEFCFGWKNLIELKLTDETLMYDTNGLSLQRFFQQHLHENGFSVWMEKQITSRFKQTKLLLEKLEELLTAEEEAGEQMLDELREFMMVDPSGELMDVNLEDVKTTAAATVVGQVQEANLSIKQLFYLGMDDNTTLINKGRRSAAEVLQFAIEQKLALKPADKDMVVMLHEIDYTIDGTSRSIKSRMIVKGEDNVHTAMAKTVGLPLGIAAKLVLQEKIKLAGIQIPIVPEIYLPVLLELEELGVRFREVSGE
jgi:saccharopine dehydrogenase-like NADP-dependent oxidoreductase